MNMKNVVIVDSVRTGLAKSFRGTFNMTRGCLLYKSDAADE